jgi:hypothetical protein
MTLEERIKDRIVAYYVRGGRETAYELAVCYYALAERRIARVRVLAACVECLRWLERAGIKVPDYLPRLSCWLQREKIKELLAKAKVVEPV